MKNEKLKTLGLNIKFARMKQNLSQEKLAELVGSSRETISNIETGNCESSILTIINIAHILKTDLNEFTKGIF